MVVVCGITAVEVAVRLITFTMVVTVVSKGITKVVVLDSCMVFVTSNVEAGAMVVKVIVVVVVLILSASCSGCVHMCSQMKRLEFKVFSASISSKSECLELSGQQS